MDCVHILLQIQVPLITLCPFIAGVEVVRGVEVVGRVEVVEGERREGIDGKVNLRVELEKIRRATRRVQ